MIVSCRCFLSTLVQMAMKSSGFEIMINWTTWKPYITLSYLTHNLVHIYLPMTLRNRLYIISSSSVLNTHMYCPSISKLFMLTFTVRLVWDAGMEKLSLANGLPFLYPAIIFALFPESRRFQEESLMWCLPEYKQCRYTSSPKTPVTLWSIVMSLKTVSI